MVTRFTNILVEKFKIPFTSTHTIYIQKAFKLTLKNLHAKWKCFWTRLTENESKISFANNRNTWIFIFEMFRNVLPQVPKQKNETFSFLFGKRELWPLWCYFSFHFSYHAIDRANGMAINMCVCVCVNSGRVVFFVNTYLNIHSAVWAAQRFC